MYLYVWNTKHTNTICMWVYLVPTCILVCIYVCLYECMYACMYICVFLYIHVCLLVYMFVRMYVCLYACCTYAYVWIDDFIYVYARHGLVPQTYTQTQYRTWSVQLKAAAGHTHTDTLTETQRDTLTLSPSGRALTHIRETRHAKEWVKLKIFSYLDHVTGRSSRALARVDVRHLKAIAEDLYVWHDAFIHVTR